MRITVLVSATAALLLLVSLSASAAIVAVNVFNFDFSVNPSSQPIVDPVIQLGDTVRWVWVSGFHSTTSAASQSESWNSGDQSQVGFTFDHTFTNTGVFHYYCDIHGFDNGNGTAGGMAGIITVVPEPGSLVALAAMCGALGIGAIGRRRH